MTAAAVRVRLRRKLAAVVRKPDESLADPAFAELARALLDGDDVSADVSAFRTAYDRVHFVRGGPLPAR